MVHGIEDSELKFNNEKFVTISDGKNKTNYFFADPSVIVSPPDKNLSLPTEDVDFRISQHQLTKLKQSAAILNLPDLSIVGDGEKVVVKIHDRKTDSSNDFGFTVGETDKNFIFNFKLNSFCWYALSNPTSNHLRSFSNTWISLLLQQPKLTTVSATKALQKFRKKVHNL